MTAEQKADIIALRSGGLTYSDIAARLKLSINTVKSFYRRQTSAVKQKPMSICKCCGNQITQPKGTRTKIFCSDKCRMQWWNSHRDSINRKAVYDCKCKCCGKTFQAYANNKRKYCSRECYIKIRFGDGGNDQA